MNQTMLSYIHIYYISIHIYHLPYSFSYNKTIKLFQNTKKLKSGEDCNLTLSILSKKATLSQTRPNNKGSSPTFSKVDNQLNHEQQRVYQINHGIISKGNERQEAHH